MIPATEATDPALVDLDAWEPAQILEALWQGQLEAAQAVGPALPAIQRAAEAAVPLLAAGGRLIYAGAGTSGRIGVQDGAELNPTFNWPTDRLVLLLAGGDAAFTQAIENAEDQTDQARAQIAHHHISTGDVAIAIAASGATPYTVATLAAAHEAGALAIAIANSPASPLLQTAAFPILLATGPEAIAGSTRLKAGTAQKIALNLLSTLMMVRLGRVYRGQMVDMQARNEKLRRRAVRMVQSLGNCDEDRAAQALAESGYSVKLALLMVHGLKLTEAQELLKESQGSLRKASESLLF